jgi:hypothetical protein
LLSNINILIVFLKKATSQGLNDVKMIFKNMLTKTTISIIVTTIYHEMHKKAPKSKCNKIQWL